MIASTALLPRWGRRKVPQIIQAELAECGLACVAMVASYYGHEIDLPTMRQRFGTSISGVTLGRLVEIADAMELDPKALQVDLDGLADLRLPLVLHWEMKHFVVLERIDRHRATIKDPAGGTYTIPLSELSKHYTGIVLELTPRPAFRKASEIRQVSLRKLTGQIHGLKRAAGLLIALAVVIEFFALLVPMQMQWVVDNVIRPNDGELLCVIASAFIVLAAIQCGISIARGYVMTWIAASANAQWVRNLFSHLMRLPLEFFQKRSAADICVRFESVKSIQTLLSGAFAQSALDGVMSVGALIILSLYSPALMMVGLAATLAYAGARWVAYAALKRATEEELVFGGRQAGVLIESIMGIQAIKIANKQSDRSTRMANAATSLAEREMIRQRATTTFQAVNQGIFGVERILLVTVGAALCLHNSMTVGMLFAALFYCDMFNTRIVGLIDKVVDFRLLSAHSSRIADIALEPPELTETHAASEIPTARIEIVNLGFRYSDQEPWVFRGVSFAIEPGKSVAIIGPSGCGKTTLAKLILGLMTPTEGEIRIGGVDIRHWGLTNYRRMIAAVMQDDYLFTGSLAQNISFWDIDESFEQVQDAARAASIHNEILAMPMGYGTQIGEDGAGMSGGQKQRVLFARALYRKPKVLVLDEATSHLDVAREREINAAVQAMQCTRIVIAHRPETIASAERVIALTAAGACQEAPPATVSRLAG